MTRLFLFLAALFLLLASVRPAAAEDAPKPLPIVAVPEGKDNIVVIHKGDPAPFTGQLFDQPSALRWANWLEQYKYRLGADVAFQKNYDQTIIDALKKQISDAQQQNGQLQKDLGSARADILNPPFYRALWFGIVIGMVIAGAAVCLAAVGFSAVLGK